MWGWLSPFQCPLDGCQTRSGVSTPLLLVSRNSILPSQPVNPVSGFTLRSESQTLKFNSGAGALAPHGENPGLGPQRIAPGSLHLSAGASGWPDPAPTHFAAVAHTEEVIPKHFHGAGPGGVDESPSEDVRQGRHPGGTHVRGGTQRGDRGLQRAHPAEAQLGLPAAAGSCGAGTCSGLVLPPLPRAIACPLQAAPRGWLPASSMPIGFFSCELAPHSRGVWFSPHPCVSFGCVNSLSYQNRPPLPFFNWHT